jgi:hypothetical protein
MHCSIGASSILVTSNHVVVVVISNFAIVVSNFVEVQI